MAGCWFVLVERRRGELGIGLLQLEILVGARRRRKRRTWLEASGDLGLVLPASAAQGAMGQCGENGGQLTVSGADTHISCYFDFSRLCLD